MWHDFTTPIYVLTFRICHCRFLDLFRFWHCGMASVPFFICLSLVSIGWSPHSPWWTSLWALSAFVPQILVTLTIIIQHWLFSRFSSLYDLWGDLSACLNPYKFLLAGGFLASFSTLRSSFAKVQAPWFECQWSSLLFAISSTVSSELWALVPLQGRAPEVRPRCCSTRPQRIHLPYLPGLLCCDFVMCGRLKTWTCSWNFVSSEGVPIVSICVGSFQMY